MSQPPASAGEVWLASYVQKLTTIQLVGGIFCHICQLTFNSKQDFDAHYSQHFTNTSDIVYTCVICRKEITGYPSFRGHCYNYHVMKNKFKCQECNKLFNKHSSLQEHIRAIHNYKCSICQQQFPTFKEMNLHKYIHKSEKNRPPYKCLFCSNTITNTEECEDHVDQHSEISYSCPICSKHIPDKGTALEHLYVHFGYSSDDVEIKDDYELITDSSIDVVGGIMCIYCKCFHKNKAEFLEHHLAEHGEKKVFYTCCICLKQHDKYENFADHCYNHTSKEKNQCELCDKKFDRLTNLVLHMDTSHSSPGSKPFTCSLCHKGFQTEKWLKHHFQATHSIQSFSCPEPGCEQMFSTPRLLILHQKIHKNLENSCNICGLQFISLAACHRHLDQHCKTVFTCPICNRKYGEKYLVKKHLVHHFECVMHLCNVCGKIFNAKHRLAEHMKIHTNTKQHICTYCGKAFLRQNLLQQHVNIHSDTKPFKCSYCYKTFASKPNLRKHLLRIHKFEGKCRDLKTTDDINAIETLETNLTPNNNNEAEVTPTILESNVLHQVEMSAETKNSNGHSKFNLFDKGFENTDTVCNENKFELNHQDNLDHISFATKDLDELKNVVFDTNKSLVNDYSLGNELDMLTPPSSQISEYPPEYGPEFTDTGDPLSSFNSELNYELILPHIDPHLTITKEKNVFESNLPYDFQIGYFHPTMENYLPLN